MRQTGIELVPKLPGLRQSAVLLRGEDEVVRLDMAMYLGAEDPRDVVDLDT